MTSRQKSLYLSAKLYELAAEFTDVELQSILREQVGKSKDSAISQAIKALMQLHKETEANGPRPERYERIQLDMVTPGTTIERSPSRQVSSLPALLDDKLAFPTVADIAQALHIPARPKESRDRYIARVTRLVEIMTARERVEFFNELTLRLNNRPDNFISKWSKLIKEL